MSDTESAPAQARKMTGAELIAAERQRQIEVEGYDAAHDDSSHGEYAPGGPALIRAAHSYLLRGTRLTAGFTGAPPYWPWDAEYWKPSTPIRNLVKAGALIAAEIDRRQRGGETE